MHVLVGLVWFVGIIQICRANKVYFHSDIAQMIGKVPLDVRDLGIDIASISSHKVQSNILLLKIFILLASDLWSQGHRSPLSVS